MNNKNTFQFGHKNFRNYSQPLLEMPVKMDVCGAHAPHTSIFTAYVVLVDAGVRPAWLKAWSQMQSVFLCKTV